MKTKLTLMVMAGLFLLMSLGGCATLTSKESALQVDEELMQALTALKEGSQQVFILFKGEGNEGKRGVAVSYVPASGCWKLVKGVIGFERKMVMMRQGNLILFRPVVVRKLLLHDLTKPPVLCSSMAQVKFVLDKYLVVVSEKPKSGPVSPSPKKEGMLPHDMSI